MYVQQLTVDRLSDFIAYCRYYRDIIDQSYLYEEELASFTPNKENPTYLLVNKDRKIIGVASLIIDSYFKKGKKGRFRIFHAENIQGYKLLFKHILSHTTEIERVFIFTPDKNKPLQHALQQLDFEIERYSFVLEREDLPIIEPSFPKDYQLLPFKFQQDEQLWCEVRNEAFSNLAGSETPITVEMVEKMQHWEDHVQGGMMILYHQTEPVGVLRVAKEENEDGLRTFIALLAIKKSYQGQGLGGQLLRAGLRFGSNLGMPRALLTVNAENENAVSLYLREGFKKTETMICYHYLTTTGEIQIV
ncbi:GNAT family N-acetyltransferase [Bacillus timonensis]|nr:GNAT family N-acetyltransferase [Bacillus timonensis]